MTDQKISQKRFLHIANGTVSRLKSIDEVLSAVSKNGYVWLDFLNPSRDDLTPFIQPLGLHQLAIEDCLDDDQVPKVEDYAANTFIIFNSFECYEGEYIINEINFFLGTKYVISVNHSQRGEKHAFSRLDNALTRDMANIKKGPDYLLHLLMDFIVDEKFKVIETIQDELDLAEEEILKDPDHFKPESLLHMRKSLLTLRKSLFHEREIMVRVCRRDSPFVTEKAIYHYRDVYDHLAKFFEALEIYREMVTSLMEMYLSMVNNRMSQISNRTNKMMRRLTLINTVFMPMTLLAGIGGMSEWSMMTGPDNWQFSYPAFILLMGIIGLVSHLILRWLESKDKKDDD